jgi:hypothetical protein
MSADGVRKEQENGEKDTEDYHWSLGIVDTDVFAGYREGSPRLLH